MCIRDRASPATYEIQQDGSQYFIATASKRLYVDYDSAKDIPVSYTHLDVYKRQVFFFVYLRSCVDTKHN